jgi:hypothetical protein
VIVPGAQPPGRPRSAATPPVAATRQMPTMDRPSATIPLPPREHPHAGQQGQRSAPQGQPPGQAPGPARQRRQIPPPQAARPVSPAPRPAPRPAPAAVRDPYRSAGRSGARRLGRVVRALFITALLIAVPVASALIAFRVARSR